MYVELIIYDIVLYTCVFGESKLFLAILYTKLKLIQPTQRYSFLFRR